MPQNSTKKKWSKLAQTLSYNLVSSYSRMTPEAVMIENATRANGENCVVPAFVVVDSSRRYDPVLRSLRVLDEFSKMRESMELFPLPGNDVELGLPKSQEIKETTNHSYESGNRMTDIVVSLSLKGHDNSNKINALVEKAMEEVRQLAMDNEPLWVYDVQKRALVLNNMEYNKRFKELEVTLDSVIRFVLDAETPMDIPNQDGPPIPPFDKAQGGVPSQLNQQCSSSMPIEATRETVNVSVSPLSVVDIMMDARLWSFAFGDMLSRVVVLDTLVVGDPSTHDRALQVMNVEYHGPSPLVPTRQTYFARHCKQLASDTWMIVDVPLDEIVPNPTTKFVRKPSGCLIEGRENGHSKVTWIEHVECENEMVHPLLKPLIEGGFMFGAKRWVDALARQCQYLEAITQCSLCAIPSLGVETSLRLRDRMRRSFYTNLSGSRVHMWNPLPIPGAQDVLVRTGELENGNAVTLTVSVTFWLPHKQEKVFGFLQDERNRSKWDMIASGYRTNETIHLPRDLIPDRAASIIQMLDEHNNTVTTTLLQEAYNDPNESYVIYTPVDPVQMFGVLDGRHSASEVSMMPSGFVIHRGGANVGGSVLTALFQLFDRSSRLDFVPLESLHTLYGFTTDTLHAIRICLDQSS